MIMPISAANIIKRTYKSKFRQPFIQNGGKESQEILQLICQVKFPDKYAPNFQTNFRKSHNDRGGAFL